MGIERRIGEALGRIEPVAITKLALDAIVNA
jgi:hypothetical protein